MVSNNDMELLVFYDSKVRLRLIIPKSLRNRIKKILHEDHRKDLTRINMRARKHVYWPKMASCLWSSASSVGSTCPAIQRNL